MPLWNFVRKSFYQDSVTLMRLTRDMEDVSDVTGAAVMMGTPQNLALLKDAGLLTAEGEAAGVIVLPSNAQAARLAARVVVSRR